MRYLQYAESGEILCTGSAPDGSSVEHLGLVMLDPPESATPHTHYVSDGECVALPARPSDSHDWDWQTKAWEPNPVDAREKKRTAVAQEFARRTLWPVQYDGASFDADEVARGRIIGTLARLMRGDGLPAGWIGWRDYDNAMHWGADTPEQVQTQLAGLAGAIEDREQALLVAAWQHKAALDALTDIDDILAYDVTQGW